MHQSISSVSHKRFIRWVVFWAACSILPVAPYTIPLFEESLSNSPQAYLVWIPAFAFCWAGWNLYRTPFTQRNENRIAWLGLPLMTSVGLLLYFGNTLWPVQTLGRDEALLLWPLWSIGVLWTFFGPRAVKIIWQPMIYLVLVWPPLYLKLISVVNPFLVYHTNYLLLWLSGFVSWMKPASSIGTFDVKSGVHWVSVYVTNSCSGSDSILAMIVLFPIMLVVFRTSVLRKIMLVLLGCILAFAGNIIRICLIIWALHMFGYWFAFRVLHPTLGACLFFVIAGVLLYFGSKQSKSVRRDFGTEYSIPNRPLALITTAVVLLVTVGLAPLYGWSNGSELKPLVVSTDNLSQLIPSIPGYHREIGTVENSSGTHRLDATYTAPTQEPVSVTMWWAEDRKTLVGKNSLSGTKESAVSQKQISIKPGVTGTELRSDEDSKPMGQFVDTSYIYCVSYDTQRYYVKVDILSREQSNHDRFVNQFTNIVLSPET